MTVNVTTVYIILLLLLLLVCCNSPNVPLLINVTAFLISSSVLLQLTSVIFMEDLQRTLLVRLERAVCELKLE